MSNEIKEKEEYEKYARDHRKELDAQEVRLGDVVTVLVGHFAGEKGVIVGISACHNDYSDPYYEVDMNCEVPEKYKCRKTLISPNNVIGGLSAHEFKVIGNHTPKQPSMEIKQGDKVRVSKDAPWLYVGGLDRIFAISDSVVTAIEDDNAAIKCYHGQAARILIIPTKYLVKVDAEAKEPKIKLGDMVRVKGNLHEPFCIDSDLHLEITNIPPHAVSQKEWKVISVENRRDCAGHIYTLRNGDSFIYNIPEDCIELVEPTAPTIKVGDRVRNIESGLIGVVDKIVYENIAWVNGVDGKRYHWKSDELELVEPTEQTEAEKSNHTISIPVEVDLSDSYWDAYAADLAKEVALKVANKYNDPEQAAEYAVLVAKAVVEGLKRK